MPDQGSTAANLQLHEQNRLRHCKVVGTIGPSSRDPEVLRKLVLAGLNVARLNFSHGDHETHLETIESIRKISRELGKNVSILQDLQGPKIRCAKVLNEGIQLERNEEYDLVFGTEQTDPKIIPIDYRDLVHDVQIGHRVMMDDGLFILEVTQIGSKSVRVKVLEGGLLKSRKGVNFPDSKLSLPAMTEKDSRDLLFGISNRVDYVALSFVQDPQDVRQVKGMIKALGSEVPVISKIEKIPAVQQIDEIAKLSDGLMVARGDLGVEASVERVPSYQRKIVAAAAKHAKPVIIATQMLDSMIKNPRATLAEVADVANGVLEGADCLMLSGETASGKYPVQCVEKMVSIIHEVESWSFHDLPGRRSKENSWSKTQEPWEDHEAVARAACEAAEALGAKAIVCLTLTGNIANTIAKWRPKTSIIAISPRKDVIQRLMMVWGVYGVPNPLFYNTDVLLQDLPRMLKEHGLVESGDVILLTAGIPINQMQSTNSLKINRIP